MARAIRFHETGGPEVLRIDEVPTSEPKSGEVRIRVHALGLNRADSMYRTGRYVIEPKFPASFGYEAAGTIDAVGPDVDGFAIGDPVAVIPAFMFDEYAVFADLAIAPARAVVKLPAGVSWEKAAATWMPFTTVWGALIDIANLGAGDFVVLGAASSSVGLAAMQIAHHVGATPIAITRKGEKLEELKSAGFTYILQTGADDIEREILRITDGQGARVVFDPVTGPDFEHIIKATCKDAIVFIYGALSHDATPIPVMHILGKHTTIRGYEFIEVTSDDSKLARAKAFITEGMSAGHFNAQIARTFKFEDAVDAYRYLESNSQFGKIVLTLE
ncbi:zinc-dependent alcohol dehydrogenase family protein [Achromobacter sp. JUb104]|uniref:zinc-dependent alcohol dehydrogenase family protein n=1 Tax=Achromobacter sp. JUb104 TaxID=2940590 RepID=UPI0021677C38|nr:zinc-dependent alcohol dehydrogenase family protein [Achromobacter sp. JUb104]MCS3507185.1 NADPH:quinone reductase-like Zn-dependent oxidoreductase [Achromobacter sp. JUb104]